MKNLKLLISVICGVILLTILSVSYSNDTRNAVAAEAPELPSWAVYVHYEFGSGLVPQATVYIKKNGSNMFDSPKETNSSGFVWFENNGSAFPDGTYEVRAEKFGYGPGSTNVTITGGVPVYPVTHVNLGTPE